MEAWKSDQPAFFLCLVYEFHLLFNSQDLSSKTGTTFLCKKFQRLESILELEKYGSVIDGNRKPTIFIIQKEATGKQVTVDFHQLDP